MLLEPRTCQKMVALLPLLVALLGCGERPADKDTKTNQAAFRDKYDKAKALFEKRCETAGIIVKRTVAEVEGIELSKLRNNIPWGGKEYFDPMYPEAAMADENRGDDYIKQFLMTEFRYTLTPERRGGLGPGLHVRDSRDLPPIRGYRFVEYVDSSGVRFRCVPTWKEGDSNWVPGQHRCEPVTKSATSYALDFEDLVDPEDRALWIAGTKLKAIDKRTGEVIAELIRFTWDPGFGVGTTGRWPWQHANSAASTTCSYPADRPRSNESRYFIDTVLVPKQGD